MATAPRPYDYDSPRAYVDALFALVPGEEIAASIGWHSTVHTVRKMPRLGSKARDNISTSVRKEGTDYVVRLHATDVLTLHADGSVTLDNGGWPTMTTHRVMNAFLATKNRPCYAARVNYVTVITTPGGTFDISRYNPVTVGAPA